MGSGGDGGGNPQALYANVAPMGNLPIAGQGSDAVPDPFSYGQFQNFLPDQPSAADAARGIKAPMATGLTNEMFTYKKPNGDVAPDVVSQLRDQLATLQQQQDAKKNGILESMEVARAANP